MLRESRTHIRTYMIIVCCRYSPHTELRIYIYIYEHDCQRVDVVSGDPYNSHPSTRALMGPEARARVAAGEDLATCSQRIRVPLVEIPLGSTEDRVCGTINMEQMFTSGKKGFVPGLLAEANQGILYIDEVNLLEDGLVDLILDSAAGGWNTVEREGISIGHPAKFMLVGSGITQNGEMRPQLLDRFGLSVNVSTIMDREVRIQNTVKRIAYDTDPFEFYESFREEMDALKANVARARSMLPDVIMPTKLQLQISQCCAALDVGLRADLTTVRGACALAALDGRLEANVDDISKVIELAVGHRMPKDPLEPIEANLYRCRATFRRIFKPSGGDDDGLEDNDKKAAASSEGVDDSISPKETETEPPEKEDKRKGLKAGAWAGPPGR